MPAERWLLTALFFLIGMCFGSFGNVVVARIPAGRSVFGRSACPHCGKAIALRDLIPVVSFFLVGRHCRWCAASISWEYPLGELLTGILFALVALQRSLPWTGAMTLALALWLFALMALLDAKTQGVPDILSVPFIALGSAHAAVMGTLSPWGPLLGGGIFLAQWMVSRGRAVGTGDIFVGVGMGALLGSWHATLRAMITAYTLGAALALVLLRMGRWHRGTRVPFVPFLFAGTMIVLLTDATTIFLYAEGLSPG